MADAVPAELRARVLDRIDDDEVVRLAGELIRIPSFTTEETPLAEWLDVHVDLADLFLCTRVLALTALEATR